MGAVPKNKITSSERGKRRQGLLRRIKLIKDPNTSVTPRYKQGLVAQMFGQMGLEFKKLLSR